MRTNYLLAVGALALLPTAAFASRAANNLDEGLHRMVEGNYPAAEQALRQAIAEELNSGIAHENLAATLRALGRNDQALAEYRAALPLLASDPKDRSDTLYGIAQTEDGLGDAQLAARAWKDYLDDAQLQPGENAAAVAIARDRLQINDRLARLPRPPGTQKASRPTLVR